MAPRGPRRARDKVGQRPTGARALAFAVLSEHAQGGRFVSAILEERAGRSANLTSEDRAFALELVNGVARRKATLDALIAAHIDRPRHRIEGELWTLLQLGVYQLALLDGVPAYAAVNETVSLARALGRRRWEGYLNAGLRNVQRSLADELATGPAADALPITGGRYRRLTRPVFPDPSTDPEGYFAAAFSFPRWIAERWGARYERDELLRLGFWFNGTPSPALRVNVLRANRDDVLARLVEAGAAARPGDWAESIRLDGTRRIDSLPGFAEGLFTVQDESAISAVDVLAPQPGESILDLCAAPGTKTTCIAERMANRGTIVATDVRPDRLARIAENCARLGVSIVRTLLISETGEDMPGGPFDAALVDVPCSNSGVLGKRPEARWRLSNQSIAEMQRRQLDLLGSAIGRVKEGGRIVYSTCSIEPEENEQIVERILASEPGLTLVSERRHIPGRPADGGYQALLRRRASRANGPTEPAI